MKSVSKVSFSYGEIVNTCLFIAADSGEGPVLPTWTAVDQRNVKSSRELWSFMKTEGWNVDVSFHLIDSDNLVLDYGIF